MRGRRRNSVREAAEKMPIELKTAEKLVRWYNDLACGCPLSQRVSRVLGSLGGGVDAAAIRSRPDLDAERCDDVKVPQRVTRLVEGVLLERALASPDLAASAFDMADKLVYCSCNNVRGNFNLSTMTAWTPIPSPSSFPSNPIKVTCPSCTSDFGKGGPNPDFRPTPLISLFRSKAEREVFPDRAETKRLYAALLGATGGCGRYGSQQSTFNGSWTCLVFNRSDPTTVEADVVISNRVSPSVRLQPMCVCSELLFAVTSSFSPEHVYKARNITVVEGGEFLYFRYTVFEEGGPFDYKVDVRAIINSEPTSETECLAAAAAQAKNSRSGAPSSSFSNSSSSSSGEDEEPSPAIKRRKLNNNNVAARNNNNNNNRDDNKSAISRMSTTNEVDVQSLLMTVLSRGNKARTSKTSSAPIRCKRRFNNNNNNNSKALPVAAESCTDAKETAATPECKSNYILPCPQIEEQTMMAFQRQSCLSYESKVVKHPVNIKNLTFNVDARPFRKQLMSPPSHTLFSPPLVIRTGLNRYRIISGVMQFFDSVEVEEDYGAVSLGNNAAHSATLRLLSYIRENSLKRCVQTAPGKGFNVVKKTATTNIRVPISSKETRQRQLCTATTLGMLAGLAT